MGEHDRRPVTGERRAGRPSACLVACGLACAAAAISCGGEEPSTVLVTDSAGVTVVTNTRGGLAAAAAWSVAAEPVQELGGGPSPEVPLYRVTAVVPLESGGVAVATDVPPRVLVFDGAGSLQATLGREGEGPGEFSSVGSVVALPPDSIAVWDPDRRRLSVFDVSGAFGREVDLGAIAPQSARAAASTETVSGFTHVLPSLPGSLILFSEAVLGPPGEAPTTRHELPAYRIATDGRVLAEYGAFPGMRTSPGLATPFGARTHAASRGGSLAVGIAEATEYRVYGPDGELERIVRWPDRDRVVQGPFLDRWTAMTQAEPALGELIRAAPRAERFPAYDDLLAGDGGEILVAAYPGPLGLVPLRRADPAPEPLRPTLRMPSRPWLVLDSLGSIRGTLTTPEGFEPWALRESLLWGVYTDGLDVESVRAYEVSGVASPFER